MGQNTQQQQMMRSEKNKNNDNTNKLEEYNSSNGCAIACSKI